MDENLIMIIVWICIFVLSLLVELGTEALVSIWFCIGAFIAGAVTYIPGMPFWGEIIVFVCVSLLSFLIIRPLVNKKLLRLHSKTNVDSIISKRGIVLKKITTFEKGEVKINDVIWNAIKRDQDEDIEKDDVVEVIAVQGNKLLVKKIEKGGN